MEDALTDEQIATFKHQLIELKNDISGTITMTKTDRAPVELDQQSVGRLSRMDAMQVQAMAKAQQRQREIDLRRIAGALSRMADGDFGFCETCDEQIAPKRLEIDPAASTCINCASKQEN